MANQKSILCVDDDMDDRIFLSNAIYSINPALHIVEAKNGLEAIKYLQEASQKNELPCMVVLDINMPLLDGKQTLEKIRMEMGLNSLPIVIFTSSENPNDKLLFQKKGVEMVTKPIDPMNFQKSVQNFLTYCS